jgi:GAF domain-containing protein
MNNQEPGSPTPYPTTRTVRLQTRLAASFAILAVLSAAALTLVVYFTVRAQLLEDARARVRDAVSIGSLQVDGDAHATLVDAGQEEGEVYAQLKQVLQKIRDAGVNYRFVYTLRVIDGKTYFIVDAEETEENVSHLMDWYADLAQETTDTIATLNNPYVEPNFYVDSWGEWLTGYAPIYTSDGRLDAVLAMDVGASVVREQTNRVLWISLGVLGALIPFVVLAGWQLGKRISQPIVLLTEGAEKITAGDLNYEVKLNSRDETIRLAQAFNLMTNRLRSLIGNLENTVAERTKDVEQRSSYLQAAAEVGRAAASILEAKQLIGQVVEVIRSRFNLYYVGLFLVDAVGEYAVLQAGTGEAGAAMLARNHRIRVGQGMIGWSIANKRPRIALEAGEDAVRLVTDLLPLTRSEAALPLISRGRVLGALTVQSDQPGVFTGDTIAVLQTMADQVALALDNARLFTESEEALDTLRRSYGELSRKSWAEVLRTHQTRGYRLDQQGVRPLKEDEPVAEIDQDIPVIKVPIRLRDQVLGYIEARKPENTGDWSQDELGLINNLVDQLSVALENARLYEDTQYRAERERVLAEITTKVRATTDVSTIMQTAILELASALRVPYGAIRLHTPGAQSESEGGSLNGQ